MVKKILLSCFCLLLVACHNDQQDLLEFIEKANSQPIGKIPKLEPPPSFEHFDYQAELLKSPFSMPTREMEQEQIDETKNCLKPDFNRPKEYLETYALDNLQMRGTLQENDQIWALIQTNDNNVARLSKGDFIGLYHGRIVDVSTSSIGILELIPDGTGCWVERSSTMELTEK